MIRKNIYIKGKNVIDMNLLIGNEMMEKFNMPFYNTDITLRKGIDNTIEFSVRNHDRKAQQLAEGHTLRFIAINDQLQQKIDKELDVLSAPLGRYELKITKAELNNFDCGTFIGHVVDVDESGKQETLYSGTDWYPYFEVNIKSNKMNLLSKTNILEITDFNREIYQDVETGKDMEKYTSSILVSNITPSHTIISKLKDFVGIYKVQGSNMETPEHNEDDWFTIDEKEYTEEFTGSVLTNKQLNSLWLRIQFIKELNSKSTLIESSYRN